VDFYRDISATIDLREELHSVIHGSEEIVGQGRTVILRRMTNTTCPGCWDTKTGGSIRPNCRYCQGEGWQFYETRRSWRSTAAWLLSTSLESWPLVSIPRMPWLHRSEPMHRLCGGLSG